MLDQVAEKILGSSDDENNENDGKPSTMDEDDEEEQKADFIEVPVIDSETRDYTVHKAEGHFTDGSTRTYEFDAMKKDSGIVLYNYTGLSGGLSAFDKEAFVFIPYNNLIEFETVERTKEVMEKTYKTVHKVPSDSDLVEMYEEEGGRVDLTHRA